MTKERPPAHAGTFYPADPDTLGSLVRSLFKTEGAKNISEVNPDSLRALIVPHGEFHRSGAVAASAYCLLRKRSRPPERVVIVAPFHDWSEYGLILPTYPAFRTPIGSLPVDRKTIQKLAFFSETLFSDEAHLSEFSIEVQLPFLHYLWESVPIVPIGYADIPSEILAHVLEPLVLNPDTLTLVSADFSRYLNARDAERTDGESFGKILSHLAVDPLKVCGANGMNALSILARNHHLSPRLLSAVHAESDTEGSAQVTGYATFGFIG